MSAICSPPTSSNIAAGRNGPLRQDPDSQRSKAVLTMYPGAFIDTNPDKPAIIMGSTGDVTTFGELDAAANRAAQMLRAAGVQPGDHVAFCMENHPRYLEVRGGATTQGRSTPRHRRG